MKKLILNTSELKKKVTFLKKKNNNKIVLCHGVFDVVHIGHIKHFEKAKKFGDILIVSITADKHVKKGPGKPLFSEKIRAEYLSSLKLIDFIYINHEETAINVLNIVKPNYYIKGQDYKIRKSDITNNILLEEKTVKKNKGKIIFTDEVQFSSSKIINSNSDIYTDEQQNYFNKTKNFFNVESLKVILKKIEKLNVLVIGETIIDQYNFCEALGKSGKDPFLTFKPKISNDYLGGAAAIANNVAVFCKKVNFISMVGEKKEYQNFINRKLKKNINHFFLNKKNSPTILKKRYLDLVNHNKVFGLYSLNESMIINSEVAKLNQEIKKKIKKADIVIVSDYGHGFISESTTKLITKYNSKLFLNTQINSANIGYHSLNKFKKINFLIINETELRHELRSKHATIESLSIILTKNFEIKHLVITRGKNGLVYYDFKNHKFYYCPSFSNNVTDKVGTGDNMLAAMALFFRLDAPTYVSLLFGSAAAYSAIQSYANSEVLDKNKLIKFLEYSLK